MSFANIVDSDFPTPMYPASPPGPSWKTQTQTPLEESFFQKKKKHNDSEFPASLDPRT